MNKFLPLLFAAMLVFAGCSKDAGETGVEAPPAEETAAEVVAEEEVVAAEEAMSAEEAVAEVAATSESAGDETVDTSNEIVLAMADEAAADAVVEQAPSRFKEGEHYTRLSPVQPVSSSPETIEVAEVFMFSCPHCYTLEPYVVQWREGMDPNVELVRIPAVFNALAREHSRAYFSAEALGIENEIMTPFFREFHVNRNPLNTEDQLIEFFAQFDVSEDDFLAAWNSFEVDRKVRDADKLVRRYRVTGVPTIVINGKYVTDAGMARGYENLFELIDELVASEAINR